MTPPTSGDGLGAAADTVLTDVDEEEEPGRELEEGMSPPASDDGTTGTAEELEWPEAADDDDVETEVVATAVCVID